MNRQHVGTSKTEMPNETGQPTADEEEAREFADAAEAKNGAREFAAAAEEAKNKAREFADKANTAMVKAKAEAEEAKNIADLATAAKDGANTARDQANTARDRANAARDQTNTARDQTNIARDQTNAARDGANTARAEAEAARVEAEDAMGEAQTSDRRYQQYREFIIHEDDLVDHRANWMMVSESFLLLAYLSVLSEFGNVDELRKLIGRLGWWSTFVSLISIYAAKFSLFNLREAYFEDNVKRPDSFGNRRDCSECSQICGECNQICKGFWRSFFCCFFQKQAKDITGARITLFLGNVAAFALPLIFLIVWSKLLSWDDISSDTKQIIELLDGRIGVIESDLLRTNLSLRLVEDRVTKVKANLFQMDLSLRSVEQRVATIESLLNETNQCESCPGSVCFCLHLP